MCATLMIAASVASTAISAVGAFQESSMAKAQAKYSAKLAERQAQVERDRAREEMNQTRERLRQTVGAARANMAGSGLAVDALGTTGESLLDDLRFAGSQDITAIHKTGARAAWAKDAEAANFKAQAKSINPFFSAVGAGAKTFMGTSFGKSLLTG